MPLSSGGAKGREARLRSVARGQAQRAGLSALQRQAGSQGPGTVSLNRCLLQFPAGSPGRGVCKPCLGIKWRCGQDAPPIEGNPRGGGWGAPAQRVRAAREEGARALHVTRPAGGDAHDAPLTWCVSSPVAGGGGRGRVPVAGHPEELVAQL